MEESDFEGTLVLEKLAAVDLLDDFFEAIDGDNLKLVVSLLRQAGVDDETIALIYHKIEDDL